MLTIKWFTYFNIKFTVVSKEVQNKVNPYPASLEIELNGDFLNISPFYEVINKEDPLKCMTIGEDTTKWKLLQGTTFNLSHSNYSICLKGAMLQLVLYGDKGFNFVLSIAFKPLVGDIEKFQCRKMVYQQY